jgi:nucleotide-binding universal stress UspA family protein
LTSNAKELWKMNTTLNRILLAAYGSEGTEFAAHTAIRLANSAECELHLVYVERLPGYPAYAPISAQHLEWELQEDAERAGLERLWELDRSVRIAGGTVAGAHLRIGEVAKEVVGLAEELEADLIIVGTRGRSVIGRVLMGSVSDSVVRHAHCPVVVARSQETDDKRKGDPRPGSPPWGTGKPRSAWSGIRCAMERGRRTY